MMDRVIKTSAHTHGHLMVPKLMMVRNGRGRGQLVVQLKVSRSDVRQRGNIAFQRPGKFLFRGLWHGTDATQITSYGKVEGQVGQPIGKLTGRRLTAYQKRLID